MVGEPAIFAIGAKAEAPECLVEQAVNAAMDDAFAAAEAMLLACFETVTLADLAHDFSRLSAERQAGKD